MVGGGTTIRPAIEKFGKNNASVMVGGGEARETSGGGRAVKRLVYMKLIKLHVTFVD